MNFSSNKETDSRWKHDRLRRNKHFSSTTLNNQEVAKISTNNSPSQPKKSLKEDYRQHQMNKGPYVDCDMDLGDEDQEKD